MIKNVLFVILVIACLTTCQSEKQSFLEKIELVDLEGADVSLDKFKNKIVILNLWATWCNPCIKEMPDLVKMQREVSEDFVLVLASEEALGKINNFKNNRPFDLQFLQIKNSMESLGVYSLPTTFIIDKEGQLLETVVGTRKWDSPKQIESLNTYLK